MSSQFDVTIFQSTRTSCACLPNCDSCSCNNTNIDEETVAHNLLVKSPETGEVRRVEQKPFTAWFDSTSLVPLVFRRKPPTISESSLQTIISEKCDETQDSCYGGSLLEFCPVYTKRHFSSRGDVEESLYGKEKTTVNVTSSAIQTGASSPRESSDSGDSLSSVKPKAVWCACPSLKHRTAKTKDILWSFKETNLEEVKILHKINYWQRGKWIIREMRNANKARFLPVEELWIKLCRFIKQGNLPHCNAKYQKTKLEVWLYCDFIHSLKVRSILENGLGNIGTCLFCVHPHGVVMTL